MILISSQDPTLINKFIQAQHPNQFLQSYDWGEFQKKLGREIHRWFVIDEDTAPAEEPTQESIISSALAIKMPLTRGRSYYYIPRGPVVYTETPVPDQNEMWRTLIKSLDKEYIKKDKILFARIEPAISKMEKADLRSILSTRYPVEPQKKSVQPSTTLLLDLTLGQDKLLSEMHQKTRYNIKLAEKKGVQITTGWDKKDVEDFWKLLEATSERDEFKTHPKEYYEKMVETLGGNWETLDAARIKLYRASLNGQTLAMNIVMSYGDTVTYLHGASSNEGRNLMAPYLLQWQAIKDAQAKQAKFYDFWGIAPTDNKNHPWAGLTRFKKGFGGKQINYWGTSDVVYHSIWYIGYKLLKKSR